MLQLIGHTSARALRFSAGAAWSALQFFIFESAFRAKYALLRFRQDLSAEKTFADEKQVLP